MFISCPTNFLFIHSESQCLSLSSLNLFKKIVSQSFFSVTFILLLRSSYAFSFIKSVSIELVPAFSTLASNWVI